MRKASTVAGWIWLISLGTRARVRSLLSTRTVATPPLGKGGYHPIQQLQQQVPSGHAREQHPPGQRVPTRVPHAGSKRSAAGAQAIGQADLAIGRSCHVWQRFAHAPPSSLSYPSPTSDGRFPMPGALTMFLTRSQQAYASHGGGASRLLLWAASTAGLACSPPRGSPLRELARLHGRRRAPAAGLPLRHEGGEAQLAQMLVRRQAVPVRQEHR
jgi:hypothetical protein